MGMDVEMVWDMEMVWERGDELVHEDVEIAWDRWFGDVEVG